MRKCSSPCYNDPHEEPLLWPLFLFPFLICFLLPFFPLLSLNNSLPSFFLFFQGFLFRPPFIPFHFCHSFLFFFSLLLSSFLASIPNSSHCSNFFLKCPPDSLAPSPNPSQILSLQKKAQSCHLSIPISARPSFSTGLDLAIFPPCTALHLSLVPLFSGWQKNIWQ